MSRVAHRWGPVIGLVGTAACSPWRVDLRSEDSAGVEVDTASAPDTAAEPDASCDGGELVQGTAVISFEAYDSICPWMYDDNLYPMSGRATARVEQQEWVPIPDGARLCGLTLTGVGWETESPPFDDHFLLTVADVVVASSSAELVQPLVGSDGLPRYSWSVLAGVEFDPGVGAAWCLSQGPDGACEIPSADAPGPLVAALDDLAVQALQPEVSAPLGVGLVVVGDNDISGDCTHAQLDVTVGWQVTLNQGSR